MRSLREEEMLSSNRNSILAICINSDRAELTTINHALWINLLGNAEVIVVANQVSR